MVINVNSGAIHRRYKHPKSAYGCDWSPFQEHLLVTGCGDGMVRVYDVASNSEQPLRTLKGHTARVFNTVWSPLLPGVLGACACVSRCLSLV